MLALKPTQGACQVPLKKNRAQRVSRHRQASARAQAPTSTEVYSVNLPKPIGVKFGIGNDGRAYVLQSEPALGNTDERIQPGDKLVRVSAPFGADVWDALAFGQTMYAIKTRNGDVYLELESRGGDLSIFEEEDMDEAERRWRAERDGGNYGVGTKEIQQRNYIARKELERKRRELFEDALQDYNNGKTEEAIGKFEEVKALEPKNYIADNFARVTEVLPPTLYNLACCYSSLKKADAGLEALESAMRNGFEDYKKIRSDSHLAFLRDDERFEEVMDKYDESWINENAINAFKSIFSFGKKDK